MNFKDLPVDFAVSSFSTRILNEIHAILKAIVMNRFLIILSVFCSIAVISGCAGSSNAAKNKNGSNTNEGSTEKDNAGSSAGKGKIIPVPDYLVESAKKVTDQEKSELARYHSQKNRALVAYEVEGKTVEEVKTWFRERVPKSGLKWVGTMASSVFGDGGSRIIFNRKKIGGIQVVVDISDENPKLLRVIIGEYDPL